MLGLKKLIIDFFDFAQENDVELYNEFSLQHELGIYLRMTVPDHKVQFERNTSFFTSDHNTIKKEIDISIFTIDKKEKYAIELKCPLNGQYPEQMYSFVKDIRFMEEMKERGFTGTACVALVSDRPFYEGKVNNGIYKYFREDYAVYGNIYKPTGPTKTDNYIALSRRHEFIWRDLNAQRKYYVIEI
ncbi:hypothetical protein [Heliomicrobium gestii]|nr:hypothetical protein [Heliomicrobium gestii]MBM7867760.1 hypothetical protein [Heliomicrobium gestii]